MIGRQRGITLLNVMIAIVVSALIGIGIVQNILAKGRQGDLDRTIEQARTIAQVADREQSRVTASTSAYDATQQADVYQYTFGTRTTTFSPVSTLNTSAGTNLPTTTVYGTPFQWLAAGALAQAQFQIPKAVLGTAGSIPPDVLVTPDPSGNGVLVTVQALRSIQDRNSSHLSSIKSTFYLETTR